MSLSFDFLQAYPDVIDDLERAGLPAQAPEGLSDAQAEERLRIVVDSMSRAACAETIEPLPDTSYFRAV